MNEIQRLNYLKALGIQQWIAKAPLLNAKPTEYLNGLISQESEDVHEKSIKNNQVAEIKPSEILKTKKEFSQRAVSGKAIEVPETQSQVISEEIIENVSESLVRNMPPCAFQIQGKRGQYLLVADLQDARGKISHAEQNLLNNISKAMNGLLENTSTRHIAPEQFKWPMFESHYNASHIDQSEKAAQESARAFLYSHIKRNHLPLLITLGKQTHFLLGLAANKNTIEKPAGYGEAQFILGPSLAEMLGPDAQQIKASLWSKLIEKKI